MRPITNNATRVGEALGTYREQSPFALRVSAPVKNGLVYDLAVVIEIAEIKYAYPALVYTADRMKLSSVFHNFILPTLAFLPACCGNKVAGWARAIFTVLSFTSGSRGDVGNPTAETSPRPKASRLSLAF